MLPEYDRLEETIRNVSHGERIYYVANPGNWGDALLRFATHKFFADRKIEYTELRLLRKQWLIPYLRGGVVVFGAGGQWCNHFDRSRAVGKIAQRFRVIVLPSSFERKFSIPNAVFFRRDEYESRERMPNSLFCHDMALYLGRQDAPPGADSGFFFRTDAESLNAWQIPPGNTDISAQGNELSDAREFIGAIATYEVVYTDRLHVAITAGLLGREVHLYPGRYFKNEAIYKTSLRERFPNISYHVQYDN